MNMYLDEIITSWQNEDIKGIPHPKSSIFKAVICQRPSLKSKADDHWQKAVYNLNQIRTAHGFTTSAKKKNLINFKGRRPDRSKLVTDNKIIQHVNSFNYLRKLIVYEKEVDIDNKLNNYTKLTGLINRMFRPQKL